LVFQTDRQIAEFGDKVSADDKAILTTAKDKLKAAIDKQPIDAEEVQRAMDELNAEWSKVSQKMYASASSPAGSEPGSDGHNDGHNDGNGHNPPPHGEEKQESKTENADYEVIN